MRTTCVLLAAVLVVGCSGKKPSEASQAAPGVAAVTAGPTAVCVSQMPVSLGVDASGPHLRFIVPVFSSVRVEQQQGDGSWQVMTTVQVKPNTETRYSGVFDRLYRLIASDGSCMDSPPLLYPSGPPNPTGNGDPAPVRPDSPHRIRIERCTDEVFTGDDNSLVQLDLGDVGPSGVFTVTVTTFDANHRPGYQAEQTSEILKGIINGVSFVTPDIPEASTEAHLTIQATLSRLVTVTLGHAHRGEGPQSVHGACVVLEGE